MWGQMVTASNGGLGCSLGYQHLGNQVCSLPRLSRTNIKSAVGVGFYVSYVVGISYCADGKMALGRTRKCFEWIGCAILTHLLTGFSKGVLLFSEVVSFNY